MAISHYPIHWLIKKMSPYPLEVNADRKAFRLTDLLKFSNAFMYLVTRQARRRYLDLRLNKRDFVKNPH